MGQRDGAAGEEESLRLLERIGETFLDGSDEETAEWGREGEAGRVRGRLLASLGADVELSSSGAVTVG